MKPTRRQRPGGTAALLLAVAFATLLAAFAATPTGRDLAARFGHRSAPTRALGSPRLRAALVRSGLLELQPPPAGAAAANGDCPPIELGAPRRDRDTPPAQFAKAALPAAATERAPGGAAPPRVELTLDPCRTARLHAQRWNHGRSTEEIGWVRISLAGRAPFETAVGVRLHGGTSRRSPPFGYRLYFRSEYGADGAPPELFGEPGAPPIAHLALAEVDDRDADGTPFPFPGEVALAIGRRAGAVTPDARPAAFSLNGEPWRPVSAIEQVGPQFLRRRFGHENFDFIKGKRDVGDPGEAPFQREMEWIASRPVPLTSDVVSERYDLESLLSWLVAVVYSGTGDLYQDALVRDRSGVERGGRWFWIHWDHDMSFRTPPRNSRFGAFRDALPAILGSQRPTDVGPARALLLRLLAEDPKFRARVAARFERALDEELTPPFLESLVARYEEDARALGIVDLHFAGALRAFFAARPEAVRAQVAAALAGFDRPAGEPERPPAHRRRRAPKSDRASRAPA